MGTEDIKVTAMNMYKYEEGLIFFYKRWPCSTEFTRSTIFSAVTNRSEAMSALLFSGQSE